jgi:hypothetical protein
MKSRFFSIYFYLEKDGMEKRLRGNIFFVERARDHARDGREHVACSCELIQFHTPTRLNMKYYREHRSKINRNSANIFPHFTSHQINSQQASSTRTYTYQHRGGLSLQWMHFQGAYSVQMIFQKYTAAQLSDLTQLMSD